MANEVRRPGAAEHVRREELVRATPRTRDFKSREAQRYLQHRERPRWALIAYLVVLAAVALIGSVTYTTYAFSRYRGEILPGVSIDNVYVGEMTSSQALNTVEYQLQGVYRHPIVLTFGSRVWRPSSKAIGYQIYPVQTVADAQLVGRHESFPEQLLDRMPIHPNHTVALHFSLNSRVLRRYIATTLNVRRAPVDAQLVSSGDHFVVKPSIPGAGLDEAATENMIDNALGTLSTPTRSLAVHAVAPGIPTSVADSIRSRVEDFLSHPPVYSIGKKAANMMTRADLAPMIQFKTIDQGRTRQIKMEVISNKIQSYVSGLASKYYRQAQDAKFNFNGQQIEVLQQSRTGRQIDSQDAYNKILAAISGLHLRAKIRLKVLITQPAIDQSNPATLGISRFDAMGISNFVGAGDRRLQDIEQIAQTLDNTLIKPGEDVSFNALVGTSWDPRVYDDREAETAGQIVPGPGGAMDQVATTWFRALFGAGLNVTERHSHVYRLPWYESSPYGEIGADAVVSPDGRDLIFHNQTKSYFLVKTHVEPLRQVLYVYVYGPKSPWQIKVAFNVLARLPHPPTKTVQDETLAPGQTKQLAFAHDGMRTSLQRTTVYPNGKVTTTVLYSNYKPWQAVVAVGAIPTATPTPKPSSKTHATATPSSGATATPAPSATAVTPQPTATFNH